MIVILGLMGLFTMFWIEVKLITTLWILLATLPVCFLISTRGLNQADCSVEDAKAVKNK